MAQLYNSNHHFFSQDQVYQILNLQANTPSNVTECLNQLIDLTSEAQDRLGHFAALYLHVSLALEKALSDNTFANPQYISRLNVVFFQRYLVALQNYVAKQDAHSLCWQLTFDATRDPNPLVIQHLLLGMNAHINYDLGIAVFEAAENKPLAPLHDDFKKMNTLLASLLDRIIVDLSGISKWFSFLEKKFGRIDDSIINFAMRQSRDNAWTVANNLDRLDPIGRSKIKNQLQIKVSSFANSIWQPGYLWNIPIYLAKSSESKNVRDIIHMLAR